MTRVSFATDVSRSDFEKLQWTSSNGQVTTLEQALDALGLPEVAATVRALIDTKRPTLSQL